MVYSQAQRLVILIGRGSMVEKHAAVRFEGLKIFLVDDEDQISWALETELQALGAEVKRASSIKQAMERFSAFGPDIAISDINLPDGNGLELLKKWHKDDPAMPVIMITGNESPEHIVTALRNDAFDYLRKPFDIKDLIVSLKRASEINSLRRKVKQYESHDKFREPFTIIGNSDPMTRLRKKLERIAKSKTDTVLIYGESGTGKELAARAIHEWSAVATEPFVEINCASIPESLLESELFGYEKGAFTDAKERKIGLFEIAQTGSVFLDEIGEMPPKLQAKLLRVIEYRRFKRLGGTKDIVFSGRIIAATNRRLEEEIVQGGFRQDLFYRINAISVFMPPLRDKKEDIPDLVHYLLGKISTALDITKPKISAAAMDVLRSYSWKGNVRELKNVLQRCLVFNETSVIEPDQLELPEAPANAVPHPVKSAISPNVVEVERVSPHIPSPSPDQNMPFALPSGGISLEDVEKSLLVQALERSKYNQSKACLLLGISRHALRYRLEKFGLTE
jgi:two-component system response regulator AtoC